MKLIDRISVPDLPYSWFDADLTEEERSIQQTIHEFAENEMRPTVEALDKMSPDEVVADGSPWFQLRGKCQLAVIIKIETHSLSHPSFRFLGFSVLIS